MALFPFSRPLPRAYFDATATAVNAADGYGTHVQRNVYDWSYGDLRVDTWTQFKYNGWNGEMGIESQGTQSGRCLQPSFRKLAFLVRKIFERRSQLSCGFFVKLFGSACGPSLCSCWARKFKIRARNALEL